MRMKSSDIANSRITLRPKSQNVGDVGGHAAYLAHGTAIASFPYGSVGTNDMIVAVDFVFSKGGVIPFFYDTVAFPDGSGAATQG
jgi:hypothetical protein